MAALPSCSIASIVEAAIVRAEFAQDRMTRQNQGCAMAEHTIPTIDLAPLRSGSDAEKREVARQIDAASGEDQPRLQLGRRPRDRLFDGTGDAARYPGGIRVRTGPP